MSPFLSHSGARRLHQRKIWRDRYHADAAGEPDTMPGDRDYWATKTNDPTFLRLQREYDEKLKDEGFVDIEQRLETKGREGMYLTGSPSSGDLNRRLFKGSTEEYYRLARQHTHKMKPGFARHVWRLHAEGLGVAKITKALKERYGWGRKKIASTIAKERAKMITRVNREHDAGTPWTSG